jgi:excisionase family DNA binding protein
VSDRLLRVCEAAERLGVDESTVRRYIRDGHLEASTLPGGAYRIRGSAIDALMDARRVVPAPAAPRARRRGAELTVVPTAREGSGSLTARVKARRSA